MPGRFVLIWTGLCSVPHPRLGMGRVIGINLGESAAPFVQFFSNSPNS